MGADSAPMPPSLQVRLVTALLAKTFARYRLRQLADLARFWYQAKVSVSIWKRLFLHTGQSASQPGGQPLRPVGFGAEALLEEVDEEADLGIQVLPSGVDGVHRHLLVRAPLGQQGDELAGLQLLVQQVVGYIGDAEPGQGGVAHRLRQIHPVVARHLHRLALLALAKRPLVVAPLPALVGDAVVPGQIPGVQRGTVAQQIVRRGHQHEADVRQPLPHQCFGLVLVGGDPAVIPQPISELK